VTLWLLQLASVSPKAKGAHEHERDDDKRDAYCHHGSAPHQPAGCGNAGSGSWGSWSYWIHSVSTPLQWDRRPASEKFLLDDSAVLLVESIKGLDEGPLIPS